MTAPTTEVPSVWRAPVVSLTVAAVWLTSLYAAVWAGIEMNGVEADQLGQAGPDVYDIAGHEIRLMVLLSTTVVMAIGVISIVTTVRRNRSARPASILQLMGTTALLIVAGLIYWVTVLLVLAFVAAPSLGASQAPGDLIAPLN